MDLPRLDKFCSLTIEKHVLAGLMAHPNAWPDVASFINETDFYSRINRTVFCVVRQLLNKGESVDPVIVAQFIENASITFSDEDVDFFDYVQSISLISINENAVKKTCQELKKFTVARTIALTGMKLVDVVGSSLHKESKEIVGIADAIYNEKISLFDFDEKPQLIFDKLDELLEGRLNSPNEEVGFLTPYPEFNKLFGGLRPGNIYAVVSRPAAGKSTWIGDICYKSSMLNNDKIKVLILDTEMETTDVRFRLASSITGVPMWYLETGNYGKDPDMLAKVKAAAPAIKRYAPLIHHYYVAGKPIEEIISIVRRWYYSEVGRGNKAIVAYDYVKLTGEKMASNVSEHQVIGNKIDGLKKLSVELHVPIITACQLNRSAEMGVDDSSAISQSDRLQWYATFVAIFRRKFLEEVEKDGEEYGTHKMIVLKGRFQGRESYGHQDWVRVMEDGKPKYKLNYLNYNIENFNIEERGSLRQMVRQQAESLSIEQPVDGQAESSEF
jgi:replicative DNA helicase